MAAYFLFLCAIGLGSIAFVVWGIVSLIAYSLLTQSELEKAIDKLNGKRINYKKLWRLWWFSLIPMLICIAYIITYLKFF
jgi:hypothetical protein